MYFKNVDSEIFIEGPEGNIQTVTRGGTGEKSCANWVAIVCHPHPLHGGTMDNKVVTTMARTCRDMGIDVVRFNYRGVGKSEGTYGEVKGEAQDLLAVVNEVKRARPNAQLLLAGFSFGTGVVGIACREIEHLAHIILVAPPVGWYTYTSDNTMPVPTTVIQGELDELVNAGDVERWTEQITTPIRYHCIDEASHFFHGRLGELADIVEASFGEARGK